MGKISERLDNLEKGKEKTDFSLSYIENSLTRIYERLDTIDLKLNNHLEHFYLSLKGLNKKNLLTVSAQIITLVTALVTLLTIVLK